MSNTAVFTNEAVPGVMVLLSHVSGVIKSILPVSEGRCSVSELHGDQCAVRVTRRSLRAISISSRFF